MLEALARGLSPRRAAEAAGLGRSTAFLWRQQDPEFAAKWNEAVAEGIDLLEDEARRRAVDGYNERPIFRDGVQVGEIRTYSDRLLIFLLKRRRPEVYARPRDANPPNGFGPRAPGSLGRKCWRSLSVSACLPLKSRETMRKMILANTRRKRTAKTLPERGVKQ